jgi:hypothetical protein
MAPDDYITITALYRALLHRDPDEAGRSACQELFRQTDDPTMILFGILASEEYRALLERDGRRGPVALIAVSDLDQQKPVADITEVKHRLDAVAAVKQYDVAAANAMAAAFYFDPPEDIRSAVMAHAPASRESYDAQMRLIFETIAGYRNAIGT